MSIFGTFLFYFGMTCLAGVIQKKFNLGFQGGIIAGIVIILIGSLLGI